MGPGRSSCWQLLEQPRIGRGISVGLGVARDGLTEKVEREGPVPPALEQRRPGSLGRSRARNKPLRLREHRRPHHPRSKCRKYAAACGLECGAEHGGQLLENLVVEIFPQVAVDCRGVVEHRHAVDEPKEPHFEFIVGEHPLARLLRPVVGRHDRRPGGERRGQEFAAKHLYPGLDPRSHCCVEPGGQAGDGINRRLWSR